MLDIFAIHITGQVGMKHICYHYSRLVYFLECLPMQAKISFLVCTRIKISLSDLPSYKIPWLLIITCKWYSRPFQYCSVVFCIVKDIWVNCHFSLIYLSRYNQWTAWCSVLMDCDELFVFRWNILGRMERELLLQGLWQFAILGIFWLVFLLNIDTTRDLISSGINIIKTEVSCLQLVM